MLSVVDKKAQEIPENYNEYVVRRIINPGVYWMSKSLDDERHRREMEQLDYLLRKNVEKIVSTEKISIGKIIAVKDESGFHRGLVTDIFNRKTRNIFLILLIDNGNLIEASSNSIYWIKSNDLINEKARGVKVSIKGIQPVALDIEYDRYLLHGLFQRRIQENWSACAYKYVKDLFEKNPCVFVKPVLINDSNIHGEIYFLDELDNTPVSLGQKLCDKGFAVFFEAGSRVSIKANFQGDQNLSIEKKIPKAALSAEFQPEEISKSDSPLNKNGDGSRTNLCNTNIDPPQQNNRYRDAENKKSSLDPSHTSHSKTYKSSWVLKACFSNPFSSSSCDSLERHANSEETSTTLSLECTKGSIFRVVKRSLELYERQKKELRGHCHN